MIDYRHMSGFKIQSMIMQELLSAVGPNNNIIDPQVKLNDDQGQPHTSPTNKDFVCEYLAGTLLSQFTNLNRVQVEAFVIKLFNSLHDRKIFKDTLRDLLLSMKSFASQNDEFYQEEKQVSIKYFDTPFCRLEINNYFIYQAALEEQKQQELERKKAIPGMIQPGSVDY